MTNILKNILTAGLASLAVLTAPKKAEAQGNVHGNVEYIQSQVSENSYPKLNMFYNLPGRVNGYTFAEFYKADKGYFGRTNLNRPITHGVGPRTTIVHDGAPFSQVGLGIGAVVPNMPRNVSASVGLLPVWLDNQGRIVRNKTEIQYFVNANLPLGFNINSFGNLNVADQEGPQWSYGEISAGRNIGPIRLSYNPALRNNGNAMPRLEHRAKVTLNFGGTR